MTYTEKILAEFVEEGANLEHDRWARWHKYSRLMATPSHIEMWDRKAEMPYIALTNEEQESDRKETRNYLPLLEKSIHQALAEERSKAWEGEAVKQAYIQGKSHGISEEYERMRGEIWGRKGMVANPDYFIRVQRELRGNQATEGLDDRVITQIVWVAKDRVLDDLLSSLPLSTNQKEV